MVAVGGEDVVHPEDVVGLHVAEVLLEGVAEAVHEEAVVVGLPVAEVALPEEPVVEGEADFNDSSRRDRRLLVALEFTSLSDCNTELLFASLCE